MDLQEIDDVIETLEAFKEQVKNDTFFYYNTQLEGTLNFWKQLREKHLEYLKEKHEIGNIG